MKKYLSFYETKHSFLRSDISIFYTKDDLYLQDYYKIRERCYRNVKNGPSNFDGSQDHIDALSDVLVVTYKGVVIGGARVITSTPEKRLKLPMETDGFDLYSVFQDLQLSNKVYCEFSRLAILSSFRCSDLLDKIVEDLITFALAKGNQYLFSMCPLVQARCYKQSLIRLDMPQPFIIHRNVEAPSKDESECGVLPMFIASLEFPEVWNGVSNRSRVYK